MNYILLDLSYLIFYRYCALTVWWKMAKPDEELDVPIDNKEFVEKFRKTFVEKIKEIPKKLKLNPNDVTFIGAKDCYRSMIWRHRFCENYKGHRVHDDTFMGGPFFKMVYDDDLIGAAGCKTVLFNKNLEADDCIALASFKLLETHPTTHQWIITNDMDYLQLARENVHLFNLKYKNLTENKNSTGDPKKDLFCKILLGDKSDNIPSVFSRCGVKIAHRCYEENEFFETMLQRNPEAKANYERNKKIIDFREIPEDLVQEFLASVKI